MTDEEIQALPTTNIEDFITWRAFDGKPEHGWLDAIDFETQAYVDALLELDPPAPDESERELQLSR
jgi:hypothetical protein